MTVPGFLLGWAAAPGPAKVLAEARTRAETGRLSPRARLALDLTPAERAEVGRLLRASWAASSEPVSMAELRSGLASHGVTVEELLIAVGGPLRDLRAERTAARSSRSADRERGLAVLQHLAHGEVDPAVLERSLVGAPSWTERAEQIAQVVRFLDERDNAQPIRLGVLAVQLFGDAHALDRSTGLGRAVARFARGKATTPEHPYTDPIGDAAAWHDAWAGVGVLCDGVSATVLVLNLPLVGDGPAPRLCAVSGEPVWLTLRTLRQPFALAAGTPDVFVCENPAVVEAAADAFGARSRPLVCTFGLPNLAATTLLTALASSTTLRVRADGDTVGWSIVDRLLTLPGAAPWRMPPGLESYEEDLLDDLLHDLRPTDP
ncbi:MAG: TIGR02679 domain-containing protein [Arachnia sp.]